jgi:Na+/proline symporter
VIEGATILPESTAWILLAVFSVLWVALGYYWGRKADSLSGFMLAGRNVGLALGAATAVATWVTSNTTMLAPQFALQMGIWGMLAYSTASIGLFLFAPMAQRIKALMPRGYTSAEFVRLR